MTLFFWVVLVLLILNLSLSLSFANVTHQLAIRTRKKLKVNQSAIIVVALIVFLVLNLWLEANHWIYAQSILALFLFGDGLVEIREFLKHRKESI